MENWDLPEWNRELERLKSVAQGGEVILQVLIGLVAICSILFLFMYCFAGFEPATVRVGHATVCLMLLMFVSAIAAKRNDSKIAKHLKSKP